MSCSIAPLQMRWRLRKLLARSSRGLAAFNGTGLLSSACAREGLGRDPHHPPLCDLCTEVDRGRARRALHRLERTETAARKRWPLRRFSSRTTTRWRDSHPTELLLRPGGGAQLQRALQRFPQCAQVRATHSPSSLGGKNTRQRFDGGRALKVSGFATNCVSALLHGPASCGNQREICGAEL